MKVRMFLAAMVLLLGLLFGSSYIIGDSSNSYSKGVHLGADGIVPKWAYAQITLENGEVLFFETPRAYSAAICRQGDSVVHSEILK